MNIKKALDYMISHSSEEDRPAYKQICSELSGHLELWVKDKERIEELEEKLSMAFNAGLEAAVTLAEKQAEWKLAHAIRALKGG